MTACTVCRRPIDGAALTDDRTGDRIHPSCFARRAPEDVLVTVAAALALVAAPAIIVWAG
jgi:hypothetical protein